MQTPFYIGIMRHNHHTIDHTENRQRNPNHLSTQSQIKPNQEPYYSFYDHGPPAKQKGNDGCRFRIFISWKNGFYFKQNAIDPFFCVFLLKRIPLTNRSTHLFPGVTVGRCQVDRCQVARIRLCLDGEHSALEIVFIRVFFRGLALQELFLGFPEQPWYCCIVQYIQMLLGSGPCSWHGGFLAAKFFLGVFPFKKTWPLFARLAVGTKANSS